jgi:hypothetical protein
MITYWDLEPKARSVLSEADVQRYLDAELMLKGVLKVEPLEVDAEPDEPALAKTTYYKLQGFDAVFASSEDASAFAKLKPFKSSYRYLSGYSDSIKYVEGVTTESLEVVPIQLCQADAVANAKADLDRVGAIKQANAKKREAHTKALKIQNDALSGLWDDWHESRQAAAQHRKVVDTFAAYVQTAGDHDVAAKFLLKVFSEEQIKAASEWTGVTIPLTSDGTPEIGPSHPDAPEPKSTVDIPF